MQDQENRPDTTETDKLNAIRNDVAQRLELVKAGFALMLKHDGLEWNFNLIKFADPNRGPRAMFPSSLYDADTLAAAISNHHLNRH